MMKKLHNLLTSNSLTRGLQRSIVRKLKQTLSVPDAFHDIEKLIERTSPGAVLDIGSHVGGTIARLMESTKLPIHGFEPTPETFETLSRRYANCSQVTLHNIALSDKTGEATFHCNANEQTNSLLDNDSGNDRSLAKHTRHLDAQRIKTVRLDEWSEANASGMKLFLKCDIQGAEGLLLAGGMRTFADQVVAFYSEAQIAPMYQGQADFCRLHQILTGELNFALHNIYPCFHDNLGRALQTDALWIKEDYLATHSESL